MSLFVPLYLVWFFPPSGCFQDFSIFDFQEFYYKVPNVVFFMFPLYVRCLLKFSDSLVYIFFQFGKNFRHYFQSTHPLSDIVLWYLLEYLLFHKSFIEDLFSFFTTPFLYFQYFIHNFYCGAIKFTTVFYFIYSIFCL